MKKHGDVRLAPAIEYGMACCRSDSDRIMSDTDFCEKCLLLNHCVTREAATRARAKIGTDHERIEASNT